MLEQILDAPGPKGADIGGSLVKTVLALPQDWADEQRFPEKFGMTGRTRQDLEFDFDFEGVPSVLRFVSGATSQLQDAIGCVRQHRRHLRRRRSGTGGTDTPLKANAAPGEVQTDDSSEDACSSGDSTNSSGEEDHAKPACAPMALQRLFTAGGGAHKFAPLFRDALRVELDPVKELAAVVDGLLFLASHSKRCRSLFTLDEENKQVDLQWPETLFPCLVVNMGSGVSILRVDSAKEGDFVRVGGTACGGATFLGLVRALTSAETFAEALALAEGGDASRCDLLVHDIYGEEGSLSLGLPSNLTAANFGRLCEPNWHDGVDEHGVCSEKDIARSLLQMVTQQSVLLSSAFARHAGCVDRVFFVGGFVDEENCLSRASIAANFRSLGGRAYFLRHSDYLGALGSLRTCIRSTAGSDGNAA